MDTSESVDSFMSFIRKSVADYNYYKEQEKLLTDERNDLIHDLELMMNIGCLSKEDIFNIGLLISEVSWERRDAKDTIELLDPLISYSQDNKKAIDQLTQTLGTVRKLESKQKTRSYHRRVAKKW